MAAREAAECRCVLEHRGDRVRSDRYADEDPYLTPNPDVPTSETGGLRFDVKPQSAEVLVDGGVAGIISDFDGRFHHLNLTAGPHRVEMRAPGYTPLQFEVNIEPHHTIEYHGKLSKT